MSEWGTPDWRDASAYDGSADWTLARWRWEFYRRRDDLRAYFDEHAQTEYERRVRLHKKDSEIFSNPRSPDEADFTVSIYYDRKKIENLFGYFGIPNPRIQNHSHETLCWDNHSSIGISHDGDLEPPESMRTLVFDLERPIEPQLNTARRYLLDMQRNRLGKELRPRKHSAKWPDYLQTLDAREAGASWRTIYEMVLAPTGRYSDKNPEKTASDVWEAARTLQFNFPS